jgi:transposase
MTQKTYIAIDISKDSLDVRSEIFTGKLEYTSTGLTQLRTYLQKGVNPLVVCEATGGYERELMHMLWKHNLPVALVNPRRIRAFAGSEGLKAKTDALDAELILKFAQSKGLTPTPAPSEKKQALTELMDRRSQLTETLAREKNRLKRAPKRTKRSIEKMIRFLEKELKELERQIRELVEEDEPMRTHRDIMLQVKGVGETTVWCILAYLGEITSLNRNQLIALAGVAPYNRDSGKWKGKRRIEGGRAKVRTCLYMAAQSAAVHNPHIKAYVDGLRARGKAYRVAIVAAMRKLLIYLQSLLKNPQKALV